MSEIDRSQVIYKRNTDTEPDNCYDFELLFDENNINNAPPIAIAEPAPLHGEEPNLPNLPNVRELPVLRPRCNIQKPLRYR